MEYPLSLDVLLLELTVMTMRRTILNICLLKAMARVRMNEPWTAVRNSQCDMEVVLFESCLLFFHLSSLSYLLVYCTIPFSTS